MTRKHAGWVRQRTLALACVLSLAACKFEPSPGADAGRGHADSGQDAAAGGARDAGKTPDAGAAHTGGGGKHATDAGGGGHAGHTNDGDAGDDELDGGETRADAGSRANAILRPTPGRTACGLDADCQSYPITPSNSEGQLYCCARANQGDGMACGTGNLGACESGNPYYCDEAADCQPGLRCCKFSVRTMFVCQATCGEEIQLCKSDAECENGLPCTAYMCRSQPVATCGPLPEGWTRRPLPDREPSCSLVK